MSIETEMCDLIIQYVQEKKGITITHEDIRAKYKYHEIVGWWWDALAYFGNHNFYFSLADIPEPKEDQHVHVRVKKGEYMHCVYRQGKWIEIGEVSERMYRM